MPHRLHSLSAITSEWLRALFAAAADSTQMAVAQPDPMGFALVRLLMAHDAVHVGVPEAAIARVLANPLCDHAFDAVSGVAAAPLLGIASRACGKRTSIRRGAMRLAAVNPFARAFVPPQANAVPALLDSLDAASRRAFASAKRGMDADALSTLAYTEYFALLAIHPLPDGNGRTARWVYAARLWHAGLADPRSLLAIPLSFAGRGSRLHLAAQLARAGEFADLFANWRDARARADLLFSPLLATLHTACERGRAGPATTALESIRTTLLVALM